MKLFINTSTPDTAALMLVNDETSIEKVLLPMIDNQRADVLVEIEKLLVKHYLKPNDLNGVVVVTGPGHFSYLRTGIVIANTFAFALNIPVAGIALEEFSDDEEWVAHGLAKLQDKNNSVPIMPQYGAEPNITTPKH